MPTAIWHHLSNWLRHQKERSFPFIRRYFVNEYLPHQRNRDKRKNKNVSRGPLKKSENKGICENIVLLKWVLHVYDETPSENKYLIYMFTFICYFHETYISLNIAVLCIIIIKFGKGAWKHTRAGKSQERFVLRKKDKHPMLTSVRMTRKYFNDNMRATILV